MCSNEHWIQFICSGCNELYVSVCCDSFFFVRFSVTLFGHWMAKDEKTWFDSFVCDMGSLKEQKQCASAASHCVRSRIHATRIHGLCEFYLLLSHSMQQSRVIIRKLLEMALSSTNEHQKLTFSEKTTYFSGKKDSQALILLNIP